MNHIEKSEKVEIKTKVPAEIYSRVVGYFRPIQQWNKGKREEYKDRKTVSYEVQK